MIWISPWEMLGEIQIIRDYRRAQEVVAMKEQMKLKTLQEAKHTLQFKVEQQCGDLLATIPQSVAAQHDYKLALQLQMESESCIRGMAVLIAHKQRRGQLKSRIFLETRLGKATVARAPIFMHKAYDIHGLPKKEKAP